MSKPRIVGVSGNLQRPSRTRTLVEALGTAVAHAARIDLQIFDLVDVTPGLGACLSRASMPLPLARLVEHIETADALIVASPTYKGSYSGLFKHLFDLVEPRALAGKLVAIVATGGGPRHALMVEHSLRPLFGFFTALTVPTAVYASETDIADGVVVDPAVRLRIEEAAAQLVHLLPSAADLAARVPGAALAVPFAPRLPATAHRSSSL